MTMLTIFVLTVYTAIVMYFLRDFKNGLVIRKATLSYFKWGFIPRFTVRERNGRFKANKVGVFYIATH
ncbi:putative transmembrane protein [Escherichia phage LL2]|uniref:Putative transmembrane protein n=1 Tax=Escherichia phage LL2 TaxID=2301650 RepID=A0A385IP98_9CAUD|nr:putative transmembrane protein [Escherichia phage LL2]AXY85321.1 putative transmembrane protein [Escherichia phage LL2]